MTVQRSQNIRTQCGLTAVEILLALALVFLVGAVVVQNAHLTDIEEGPRGPIELVLLDIIQQAHRLAYTEHQTVELSFDEEAQQIVLVALPSGIKEEYALPKSSEPWEIEFRRREPEQDMTGRPKRALEDTVRSRLIFHPIGGTSPAAVRIRRGMELGQELWLEPFSAHWQNPVSL
jgi:hypothetical protein